jgi:hypothetical protein
MDKDIPLIPPPRDIDICEKSPSIIRYDGSALSTRNPSIVRLHILQHPKPAFSSITICFVALNKLSL